MKVHGAPFRTIWFHESKRVVQIIDQRWLPHEFVIEEIGTVGQMAAAIREMHVRGAGLIGAAAGFGMYLAAREAGGVLRLNALLRSNLAVRLAAGMVRRASD